MSDPLSTAAVRKLIHEILLLSSDVEAFCIDYFPMVSRRFTAGQDRTERINILLSVADLNEIVRCLRAEHAEVFEKKRLLLPIQADDKIETAVPPKTASLRRDSPRKSPTPTALTVQIKRSGDTVTLYYSLPGDDRVEHAGPVSWKAHWAQSKGQPGKAVPLHALSRAEERIFESWLESAGDTLFQLLFPDLEVLTRLLQRLFQIKTPSVSPSRNRLRVRILTTDAELSALPWALTAWDGRPLSETGWSFELVAQEQIEKRAVLQSPVRVLVIAPDLADEALHLADLRTLLDQPDPEFFQVVRSRDELSKQAALFPSDLVYFLGRGCVEESRVSLLLSGNERLDLSDLLKVLRHHLPQVLFLNGGPSPMTPQWLLAPRRLLPAIPLIIVGRGGPFQQLSTVLAGQFLRRFLQDKEPPPLAIGKLESPIGTPAEHAPAAFVAWTAYDSIEVRQLPSHAQRKHPKSHLRLDRILARAAVIEQVTRLVRSKARRVEALIAHADKENLLSDFAWQAVDHIERQEVAPVRSLALHFPFERTDLPKRLEHELLLRLEAPGQLLSLALTRFAPKVRAQAQARLVWLDWGLIGEPGGKPKLKPDDVAAWLQFCFDTLVRACPNDVRIVSYLAMHIEEHNQKRLRDDLEQQKRVLICDQFRAFLLPALPLVDHSELVEFLTEPDNTSCPPSLAVQAASLIYTETSGIYEKTVQRIAWAEKNGWASLVSDLLRNQGQSSASSLNEEY